MSSYVAKVTVELKVKATAHNTPYAEGAIVAAVVGYIGDFNKNYAEYGSEVTSIDEVSTKIDEIERVKNKYRVEYTLSFVSEVEAYDEEDAEDDVRDNYPDYAESVWDADSVDITSVDCLDCE